MKNLLFVFSVLFVFSAYAQTGSPDDDLKYFVVQGTPKPEVMKMLVDNPSDPWPAAEKMVASIEGAKLIDYYFEVGKARNLAIIALPDSKYAAALVYQRMGSMFLDDMTAFEVIPSSKVAEMLGIAKKLNEADSYSKEKK